MATTRRSEIFGFSRNGEASSINRSGEVVFYKDNEARELYEGDRRVGVLIERPAFNYLAGSFTPKEQSIVLNTGTYTFHGKGQGEAVITFDGVSLLYTGSPLTFSITSPDTSVHIAPESSLMAVQLEDGQSPSSLIRTPQGAPSARNEEVLSHGRDTFFSRNSGSLIGEMMIKEVEEGAVYFSITDKKGFRTQIRGRGVGFVFHMEETGQEIEFINPLPFNGAIRWAIVYHTREGYIRCYLNEEVGELSLDAGFTPEVIEFAYGDIIPSSVLVDRYEYRPKALTNGEVSRKFGYEFELAYDFEVSPDQVSDWAARIFGSSLFGFGVAS